MIPHAPLWVRSDAIFIVKVEFVIFPRNGTLDLERFFLHFDTNRSIVGNVLLNFARKTRYLRSSIM